MARRTDLTPQLDGTPLTRVADDDGTLRHRFNDGAKIPEAREKDVVYVSIRVSSNRPDASGPAWFDGLPSLDGPPVLDDVLRPNKSSTTVTVGDETFTENDVAELLMSVPAPRLTVSGKVEASFFHRTLLAWLGEDTMPHGAMPWPYGFWKASVDELADVDAPKPGAHVFEAHVFRGDSSSSSVFRYWLKTRDDGGIAESGWMGDAPDLLDEDESAFTPISPPSPADLFATLDDDHS